MSEESKSAVYVSFVTFKNALDSLSQLIPNQIDRSTFPGLSGGVQNQLFAALKFLDLMTDDSKPTDSLRQLAVPDEAKRKEKLKQILEERYAELFALDLQKTTPNELTNRMGTAYNVSGDTRGRAVRFFLSAVKYVDVPVSRLFDKQYGTANNGSSSGASRSRRTKTTRTRSDSNQIDEVSPRPQGTSREIHLRSGGTLTLTASLDIFQLSSDDRTFLFKLVDEMEKYEKEEAQ